MTLIISSNDIFSIEQSSVCLKHFKLQWIKLNLSFSCSHTLSAQVLIIQCSNHLREFKTEKEISALSNIYSHDTERHKFYRYDTPSAQYLSFFLKLHNIPLSSGNEAELLTVEIFMRKSISSWSTKHRCSNHVSLFCWMPQNTWD